MTDMLQAPESQRPKFVRDFSLPNPCALERDFPVAAVSQTALAESWRKEVHRPATHTHKWWAQRLGTVFRAVIIGACSDDGFQTLERINKGAQFEGLRILDPFAGSGTTMVESIKLGASCSSVDINPVASLVQRQALQRWDMARLWEMYRSVEERCRAEIDYLHTDSRGRTVLYYFWVATAPCVTCGIEVDLFSSSIFAKHAYPRRHPQARVYCSTCDSIIDVCLDQPELGICTCGAKLTRDGPVRGQMMTCPAGHESRIIDALGGNRPRHRLYAKLVLDGESKSYAPIDKYDQELYEISARRLGAISRDLIVAPVGDLSEGYNTRQALRWGFERWRDFFNKRQLYCLGLLGQAIKEQESSPEREALCTLFSGTLEFNNMFCSFKGEGTGAVRHMFSHHVLRPERTPLEAHPWGTPKSSGSFSTLFKSRLLRAHNYKADPHDIVWEEDVASRRHHISAPLTEAGANRWEAVTADSACLPYSDDSFDLVVTDPPYFDNVHYSELADFFHSWLRNLSPFPEYNTEVETTRSPAEAQSTDAIHFREAMERILIESARVLKQAGCMVFSFHHGDSETWLSVCLALRRAGLVVTAIQPVKAEMSTSSTKRGSNAPNNLDSLVVCRPSASARACLGNTVEDTFATALNRLSAIRDSGVLVGEGDVRSVVAGSVIALSTMPAYEADPADLLTRAQELAEAACADWQGQLEALSGDRQNRSNGQ